MINEMLKLDIQLFTTINRWGKHHKTLDWVMALASNERFWVPVLAGVIAIGLYRRDRRLLVFAFIALLAVGISDYLCYQQFKPFFERVRPCHALHKVRLLQAGCGSEFGFPSNHAANAFATYAAAFYVYRGKWIRLATGMIAGLVSISRVYLGVHYPGDVLAGAVVGLLVGAASIWILRKSRRFTHLARVG